MSQELTGRTLTELTAETYQVPANERHLYHAVIEIKKFDPNTGERLSVPRLQKFGMKAFENGVADNLKRQGYDIKIVFNPHGTAAPLPQKPAKPKRRR